MNTNMTGFSKILHPCALDESLASASKGLRNNKTKLYIETSHYENPRDVNTIYRPHLYLIHYEMTSEI